MDASVDERATARVTTAALSVAGVAALGLAGTLATQVVWVARRRLPALGGHDASGAVGLIGRPRVRLVVLGDSTTTGPGLDGPEQIWLHRALRQLELEVAVDVVSLAVGGSRVADVARRVSQAAALRPDAVVVAVGANDAIHATPAPRFERELSALLDQLVGIAPVACANVGDLGNIERVPRPLTHLLRQRSRIISRRIERVVAHHEGVVLLDVTSADPEFRRGGVFGPDLFHPNADGHALWAAAALPGLRDLFERIPNRRLGSWRQPVDT